MHYLYWTIDIACIALPFLFSFHPKIKFYKEWKWYLPSMFLVAILFLVWDEIFTKWGVWGFNPKYLSGHYLGNLPLEEIAFFICIPYACVFTYFVIQQHLGKILTRAATYGLHLANTIFSLLVVITAYPKLYTTYTFLFCLIAFCIFIFFLKVKHLQNLYLSYLAILPFFFLSNGLLTGSFIPDEVVWYNNAENLNIRIFTIPMEDIWYGFLLISLNVFFYEKFNILFR